MARVAADPRTWGAKDANASAALRLQRPDVVFFEGELRPWDEAVLHISSEAVVRGLNVFEGLKAYRQPDGRLGFVLLRRHHQRLARSARLLHIPLDEDYDAFRGAVSAIARALDEPGNDLYVRATLLVTEGHYGIGTVSDLVLTAYQQDQAPPEPISLGVSTWQRSADLSMPPRIKTGSNYQVARLARIEGRSRGFADMILLNQAGRVAEATGACVLLVRDGRVVTPPAWEGAMESITIEAVEAICGSLGIPFERRPVDRSELYVADELAIAGTLVEITPALSVDERLLPPAHPVLDAVAARYRAAVTGSEAHPAVELAFVD